MANWLSERYLIYINLKTTCLHSSEHIAFQNLTPLFISKLNLILVQNWRRSYTSITCQALKTHWKNESFCRKILGLKSPYTVFFSENSIVKMRITLSFWLFHPTLMTTQSQMVWSYVLINIAYVFSNPNSSLCWGWKSFAGNRKLSTTHELVYISHFWWMTPRGNLGWNQSFLG